MAAAAVGSFVPYMYHDLFNPHPLAKPMEADAKEDDIKNQYAQYSWEGNPNHRLHKLFNQFTQLSVLRYDDPRLAPLFKARFPIHAKAALELHDITQEQFFFLMKLREKLLYDQEARPRPSPELLHPHSPESIARVYHEVVRRVPDWASREKQLDSLPDREIQTKYLVEWLNSPKFSDHWKTDPFFKSPQFHLYALFALKQGRITQHQFGTLMTFDTARKYVETLAFLPTVSGSPRTVKILPIFSGKQISSHMTYLLHSCLTLWEVRVAEWNWLEKGDVDDQLPVIFENKRFIRCSDKIFQRFLDLLETLSESEKTFLLHEDTEYCEKGLERYSANDIGSVSYVINFRTGINILSRVTIGNIRYRMIPSFGMVQAFIKALNPIDPIILNPVLNISSLDDIRSNGLLRMRDCLLCSPFSAPVTEADSHLVFGIDYTYHDWYHGVKANGMPALHHQLLVDIFDCIENLRKLTGFGKFRFLLIDAEHMRYPLRREVGENQELLGKIFWTTIAEGLTLIEKRLSECSPKKRISPEGEMETMCRIVKLLLSHGVARRARVDESTLARALQDSFVDKRASGYSIDWYSIWCFKDLREMSCQQLHLKLLCFYKILIQIDSIPKNRVLKANLQRMDHLV